MTFSFLLDLSLLWKLITKGSKQPPKTSRRYSQPACRRTPHLYFPSSPTQQPPQWIRYDHSGGSQKPLATCLLLRNQEERAPSCRTPAAPTPLGPQRGLASGREGRGVGGCSLWGPSRPQSLSQHLWAPRICWGRISAADVDVNQPAPATGATGDSGQRTPVDPYPPNGVSPTVHQDVVRAGLTAGLPSHKVKRNRQRA